MDEIDHLLSRMEEIEPPNGLAEQTRIKFRRRYYRHQAVQMVISVAMVLSGVWLFAPWLITATGQYNLPQNGLVILQSFTTGLEPALALDGVTQNAAWIQSNLTNSIELPHWLGLASLITGSILGLRNLLPGRLV